MVAIQLLDVAVHEEREIGDKEDEGLALCAAIEPEGEEEVAAAHDDDGAAYRYLSFL